MEYRPLKITVVSAEGLKDVKLLGKMDLYAEISLAGYRQSMKKTFVDKNCGSNPKWNFKTELIVDEVYLTRPGLSLLVRIRDDGAFGDKDVGSLTIPINDLFHPDYAKDRVVDYQVITPSRKPKGTLRLSYRFGEKFTEKAVEPKRHAEESMMGYPAAPYAAPRTYDAPPPGYPPPQYAQPYSQPAYAQSSGYGYQPQPGYGYAAPPPQYAPYTQPPKKNNMGGLGLGLGAGLLGGFLLGEAVSDIGESAAYADGYGDAMGDIGF